MQKQRKRQRRSARSADLWKQTIEAWRGSGLSAEVYCERHDVGVHSLYKWAGRLRQAGRAESIQQQPKTTPRFVAVKVATPAAAAPRQSQAEPGLELEWPSGAVLRLRGAISAETLATVVRAAAEVAPC